MFSNKTAWFSASCPEEAKTLWVQQGGELTECSLAMFVFSNDWEHEDTAELAESEAYLKQHLAVFKADYVKDAVKDGVHAVSLGAYFLVPEYILRRLKTGVTEDLPPASDSSDESSIESSSDADTENETLHHKTPHTSTGTTEIQEKGAQSLFLPRTSAPSASLIGTNSRDCLEVNSGDNQAKNSRSSADKPGSCEAPQVVDRHAQDEAHAGLVNIDDLPKVSNVLQTIDPKMNCILRARQEL